MMGRGQKIVTVSLWGVLVLIMLGVIGAGLWPRLPSRRLPVLFDTPPFELIDQNERTIGAEQLNNQVWIVNFIFTNCAGPCPIMTSQMARLEHRLPQGNIRFVSVSVDPERDTPKVLKEYSQRMGADSARWHFLTGPKEAVWELVAGMKLPGKPADDQGPILHSEKFLLVDRRGAVRGAYSARAEESVEQLVADAAMLSNVSGDSNP